jgi:hypothetical protein
MWLHCLDDVAEFIIAGVSFVCMQALFEYSIFHARVSRSMLGSGHASAINKNHHSARNSSA